MSVTVPAHLRHLSTCVLVDHLFCNHPRVRLKFPLQMYLITSFTDTPERPRNITAVEIQSRYLVLTWVEPHDNNAPIQGYFVFYSQPRFAGGEMMMLQTVVTMVNVTELYPGVTYNFTILAFNEVGNSSSSDVTPFRTLDEGEP